MGKKPFVRRNTLGTDSRIRILIAHDHALFREPLEKICQARRDLKVIGQASDGAEAVRGTLSLTPDILFLDFSLRKITGLEVLKRVRSVPRVRAVFLTVSVGQQEIVEALELGACGILSKEATVDQLMECINAVHGGRVWIRQDAVAGLVKKLHVRPDPKVTSLRSNDSGATRREMEVIAAVTEGRSNREIAQKLSISQRTVKHHLTSIFEKFGVSSRLELALYAREKNLFGTFVTTA